MYCSKCGTKNSGKGLYCKHCGASLVEEALEEEIQTNDYTYDDNKYREEKEPVYKTVNKSKNKTKNKNINRNNNKRDKKDSKNNKNEKQIIHKTSPFQKFMIAFMIIIIIILTGGLIVAGLYIFQDKTVEVPDVVGSNVDQATLILENMDLRVKVHEEKVEEEQQNNIVLKQNKAAGEFVAKNSRIILTIGKYDAKKLENYIGMSIKEAQSKLKRLGIDYEIKEIESTEEEGIVISQTPTQGSVYNDNTKVVLTVSKKVKTIKETDEEKEEEQIETDEEEQ